MIYTLSIDWLSLYGIITTQGGWCPVDDDVFAYKRESFGTRSFSVFTRVYIANENGGRDDFAEVQSVPYSSILPEYAVIIRFVNRSLYATNFWEVAGCFFDRNFIDIRGISRVDIAADFNQFATITAQQLIEGFASKKFRHIGRGIGALYFNHGVNNGDYGVNYTGLTFGTHSSDAHVYLYNKSFELLTQGDKPWIRERWRAVGLDVRYVWRLEVSIKSKGLKFKDKATNTNVEIGIDALQLDDELLKVYHTFVKKLFSFIRNRDNITNISREPRLVLFEDSPTYDRGVIKSDLSPAGRLERVLIKSLWTLSDRYRGMQFSRESSRDLASDLANSTGLGGWLAYNSAAWEIDIVHK